MDTPQKTEIYDYVILSMAPVSTLVFYAPRSMVMDEQKIPLGSLVKDPQGNILGGFYWRDEGSPQGFGPFESLADAATHHGHMFTMMKMTNPVTLKPTIIQVDFVAKKRIG